MAKKQALRQEFRAKRQAIPQQELADASAQILKEVLVQNLVPDGLLMLYVDHPVQRELPMQHWFECFENQHICVPKIIDARGHMEAVMWNKDMLLTTNKWGILEPKSTAFIDPKTIAVVVVPLLCFDTSGQRVGYGKGYYDRFLARCAKQVKTIGVCFFDPVEPIEDTLSTDVSLDVVVTPKHVHFFR